MSGQPVSPSGVERICFENYRSVMWWYRRNQEGSESRCRPFMPNQHILMSADDGDDSSPVTKPVASKKAEAPAAVAAPARNVPGAGTKPSGEQGQGQRGAGGERGRGGRYPGRGGPRNVYRGDGSGGGGGDDAPQRNTGPTSSEGVAQGFETPGGFDGERVGKSQGMPRGCLVYFATSSTCADPQLLRARATTITSGTHTPKAPAVTGPSRTTPPAATLHLAAVGTPPTPRRRAASGGNTSEGAAVSRTARRRWTRAGARTRARRS